jgi:class 3 adenylate cyclase/tetratricopeptide (TPR) repeat protein
VESWSDAAVFVPRLLLARPVDAPRWWHADGTMVLIDISGFTSLSDQLARRGRVGTEDLVATLNRIFTLLLSATDDGGDVVKFAGDALLIFYDGPDHELRACHAAYVMQRLLGVVGAVELAGARARLRMSVGVQAGRFEFLVTGREHRNLILTGPALTQVMCLQDAAQAGEILIDRAIAAALPASSVGGERDGGVLLRRMRPVPSNSLMKSGRMAGRDTVAGYLPAAFASCPDLLGADSDHRRAAVGFVQVAGLDRQMADRTVLTRIDALTAVVEDSCIETETTLLYTDLAKDGFRYVLTAGAPRGVEDPDGRLLRALIRVCAFDGGLSLRAGASAGAVFAGAVGAPFRRTYTVMGDTINLAARLTARAPSGRVLTHAPLLDRSLTHFAAERHDPLTVKGKPDPIPVAVVRDVIAQRGRPLTEVPFVGRPAELAVLADVLERARRGRGSVVEIIGDAGLGKSRLAGEALSRGGLPVIRLAADPYGAQVPYRGLQLLLRPLLGVGPADDADAAGGKLTAVVSERAPELLRWLPLLAPAVGAAVAPTQAVVDLDAQFRTARLHDAVRGLVRALLSDPTLILIDDAQWIDETSARALATAFADAPLGVILTRRDTDGGLRGSETMTTVQLRLAPMDPESARQLVSERTRRALRSSEVHTIVGRGGGSPYFLLELATAGAGGVLPETVEDLVGARIDSLETSERDTLRQAAVLGSRFHSDLYATATGDRGSLDGLAGPALASFVTADRDGTITFKHEIYREVAYGQLTFRARRHRHRLAAEAIEGSPNLAGDARLPMLALHFYSAGVWDRAFDYAAQAAAEARGRFASDEAAAFCRTAIDAGRRAGVQPADLRDLYVALGDSCRILGRLDEAYKAYRLARRQVSDPSHLVVVLEKMAFVQLEHGRFTAARRGIAEIKRIARNLPAALQTEVIAEADLAATGADINMGRFADARKRVTRVIDNAESLKNLPAGKALIARAFALYDSAAGHLEGPGATRYGSQAIDIFREIGDLRNEARLGSNQAASLYYAGSWDEAVTLQKRTAEVADRIGDVVQVGVAAMNLAEILGYQGRLAEARVYLNDALKTFRAHNIPHALAHAYCFFGVVARLDGDLAGSRLLLDSAMSAMADAGVRDGFVVDEVISRRLELMVDEKAYADVTAQGLMLVARSPEPMSLVHQARVHRSTGRALRATGDRPSAERHLRASLRIARDLAMPYEIALTLDALSDTDDDNAREAARIFSSLGVRPHGRQ